MFYKSDGKQIKALSYEDVFGISPDGLNATVLPREYYAIVPFIRRAVRLRANAIQGVPITLHRGETDISGQPEWQGLMGQLPALLWRTEVALCLSPYGAYWRRTTNTVGRNPTPEWLLPQAVWPNILAEEGLRNFRYTHPWGVPEAGKVEYLNPDEVVYFWYPSIERINWPGTPPGITALAAGKALNSQDTFVSSYFDRGAIKAVLLSVPPGTNPEERSKLQTWWRSLVAGLRNAWKTTVISADVKPITIGEGVNGQTSESLTRQYRQDVAAAFDIPETMLMQGAANYATAVNDRISFYEETVFPELGLILNAINTQWLMPRYKVELRAHPEQTEARQDAQVQQASAITELVGEPVLTVDEGRAWLGMEPMTEEREPDTEDEEYRTMDEEADEDERAESESDTDPETTKSYPDTGVRQVERSVLWAAHATQRAETRKRHYEERLMLRKEHMAARSSATDPRSRLRATNTARQALRALAGRHAAERAMMRSMQAAERARMRERHANERQQVPV